MTGDWRIFKGDQQARGETAIPAPPPWRRFPRNLDERGRTFRASEHEIRLVNAALYLRRPLLVTGPPGSGKSSLAYAVAAELELGQVLVWAINSRSTLADGLYRYDAIARLRDASLERSRGAGEDQEPQIGDYMTLGPLGTALLPRGRPRVLLIDEIDKSDVDLPNDLLHVFEEGRFEIPELVRIAAKEPRVRLLPDGGRSESDKVTIDAGRVEARAFPFVIITSNGERELPPAFLRRCLRLETPRPDLERLREIVSAHLGDKTGPEVEFLLQKFLERREEGRMVAVDQLLNAIFLATSEKAPEADDWDEIRETLLRALDDE